MITWGRIRSWRTVDAPLLHDQPFLQAVAVAMVRLECQGGRVRRSRRRRSRWQSSSRFAGYQPRASPLRVPGQRAFCRDLQGVSAAEVSVTVDDDLPDVVTPAGVVLLNGNYLANVSAVTVLLVFRSHLGGIVPFVAPCGSPQSRNHALASVGDTFLVASESLQRKIEDRGDPASNSQDLSEPFSSHLVKPFDE